MVVISHYCDPHQLIAYPTIPLNQTVAATVQHDFAVGSFARFGNPSVTLSIQDRLDFYNASHYSIRERLDLEGLLQSFVIIDGHTAASHAIWYVETTAESNSYTASAIEAGHPPVTHPGEEFTVWQARSLTWDLPLMWACIDVAVSDLYEYIDRYTLPYDPHNPQDDPFTLGVNFSSKEEAQAFWGPAYITAEYEEIVWSTDIEIRRRWSPDFPVVTKLTEEAARGAGLLSEWMVALHVPRPSETVSTSAPYDWDSPKWAQNEMNVWKRTLRSLSIVSPSSITDTSVGACQNKWLLGMDSRGVRNSLGLKLGANWSQPLRGVTQERV